MREHILLVYGIYTRKSIVSNAQDNLAQARDRGPPHAARSIAGRSVAARALARARPRRTMSYETVVQSQSEQRSVGYDYIYCPCVVKLRRSLNVNEGVATCARNGCVDTGERGSIGVDGCTCMHVCTCTCARMDGRRACALRMLVISIYIHIHICICIYHYI